MEEIHDDPGRGYSPIGSDSLIVPWCIIPIFDFDVSWGDTTEGKSTRRVTSSLMCRHFSSDLVQTNQVQLKRLSGLLKPQCPSLG
jgi:hypothetical protein